LLMHVDAGKRWAITNGMWTYGASSPREFIRMNRNYRGVDSPADADFWVLSGTRVSNPKWPCVVRAS
jgi:hypothetical protein